MPFARTRADRERTGDPRLSIEERYRGRDEYVGKFAAAALDLVEHGYLLQEDVADLLEARGRTLRLGKRSRQEVQHPTSPPDP